MCMQEAKALERLCICAGSSEPLLLMDAIIITVYFLCSKSYKVTYFEQRGSCMSVSRPSNIPKKGYHYE